MPALSRDALLANVAQSKLAEEDIEVPGLGTVRVRELTGAQRARVLQVLAPAASTGSQPEIAAYQKALLQNGIVDPADGQPVFDVKTIDQAMGLGAAKVGQLCSAVERLSGLDSKAQARAEGNSETSPSSTSTSD